MVIEKGMKKVGEIEFLRFFFAVVVMLRHSLAFMGSIEKTPFAGGALAVEFFFIVSGYLLMMSVDRIKTEPEKWGTETVMFLKRKIAGFFPEYLLSFGIAFVLNIWLNHLTVRQSISKLIDLIWELLIVSKSGLTTGSLNPPTWYLSTMLICMAILYPLLRKYKNMMANVAAPLATLFIFGYMCMNFSSLRDPEKWIGLTYKGNLRGFAELCLGISVYQIASELKKPIFNTLGRVVLSLIKWSCYALFIRYLTQSDWDNRDYFYTMLLAIALVISFSRQSWDSRFFDNRLSLLLGGFSLPLYLCHYYYAKMVKVVFGNDYTTRQKMGMYIIVSVLSAVLVMRLAKVYRIAASKIKVELKQIFLK